MDHETELDKLAKTLASGRAVLVAGTGVAVAACGNQMIEGYPVATWRGLLEHGVKHCRDIGIADEDDEALLLGQIRSGKTNFLVSAAEDLSQRMLSTPGVFRGWLKDSVGSLAVSDGRLLDVLSRIPGVLATLNYDGLLERHTARSAVTWRNEDRVQGVLQGLLPESILHLHGWYEEPESVVLGLGSYLAVRDDPHARAVLQLLTLDRTMVFVGCGDTLLDPNFACLVQWAQTALRNVAPRHYVLCRASEVAAFNARLAGARWLRPLSYGSEYPDLAPFLRQFAVGGTAAAPAPPERSGGKPTFDIDGYRHAMRKRYGRLKLEELDPTTHDIRPVVLTHMFVPQNARECTEFAPRDLELPKELLECLRDSEGEAAPRPEDVTAETNAGRRRTYQAPRPVLDVAADAFLSRLVVLGDPGSGKSTLLQYLLLRWAEQDAPAGEPLPLLIELREYARLRHDGRVHSFLGFLHDGASVRWHLDKDQLHAWLEHSPSLVLFDGLDEVFDPLLRSEISIGICRFADEYALARVVVTSRLVGFSYEAWRDEGFRSFMLEDLNRVQMGEFLTRWHGMAYEITDEGARKRDLLLGAIDESRAIRQLAGNPLLLTMMAILNRTQDLPRDRAELYEQCARLLLHQWKVDVAFAGDPELRKASLDFRDKRALLLRVARAMEETQGCLASNLIPEERLERALSEGLRGVPDVRADRAGRALISQLRGRNFMLCSVGSGNYAFVHRTFLEYFCAVEIRERFQTEQTLSCADLKRDVFGRYAEEHWHEIVCLLAGMLAPRFVRELLDDLCHTADPRQECTAVMLSARCVGEVRRRDELGAVGVDVLRHVQALSRFEPVVVDGARREQLASTVQKIRTWAVEIVAFVWRTASGTREWLAALAHYREDEGVRRTAIRELARGWRDDPWALEWLKRLAELEHDESIRLMAWQELARGWAGDPDSLRYLLDGVHNHHSSWVRHAALQELLDWKNDTVFPELVSCVTNTNDQLGEEAARGIVRRWGADARTLACLKAWAHPGATAERIRALALEELSRRYRDEPGVAELLATSERQAPAKLDPSSDVQLLIDAIVDPNPVATTGSPPSKGVSTQPGSGEAPVSFETLRSQSQSAEDPNDRLTAARRLSRTLGADPRTLGILLSLARDDDDDWVRSELVSELAERHDRNDIVFETLCSLAADDPHWIVRQRATQSLADGWKTTPALLPILQVRAENDPSWAVRRIALSTIGSGWKHDTEVQTWFESRAERDEEAETRKFAAELAATDAERRPGALATFKRLGETDTSADVRASFVALVTRLGAADPDTASWLQRRAEVDSHVRVRRVALREYACAVPREPTTVAWLRARAHEDPHVYARRTAMQLLVRGFRCAPGTAQWIRNLARSDERWETRSTMLQELARGFKESADTRNLLREAAESDAHVAVRMSAVRELTRYWREDPQLLSWLKGRAESDADLSMKAFVAEGLERGWFADDPEAWGVAKSLA